MRNISVLQLASCDTLQHFTIMSFAISYVYIYIYIVPPPKKKKQHVKKGEVGGTNKSESAMCMWHLINMLNEAQKTNNYPPQKAPKHAKTFDFC